MKHNLSLVVGKIVSGLNKEVFRIKIFTQEDILVIVVRRRVINHKKQTWKIKIDAKII
jgi:hypothetical protein